MWAVATTQSLYVQPSASTANTCSGGAWMVRLTIAMHYAYPDRESPNTWPRSERIDLLSGFRRPRGRREPHRHHGPMTQQPIVEDELAGLAARTAEAAACFMRGDMRRYFTLIQHTGDYTLMPPYGGEPRRGVDTSDPALDAMAAWFTGGEAELEIIQAHASGDLAVLVAVERQHGLVGGLPDQH